MKADRQAMHRRAQKAEGMLAKVAAELEEQRKHTYFWLRSLNELRNRKALSVDDLRDRHWIIRKPSWLWRPRTGVRTQAERAQVDPGTARHTTS